MTKINVSVKKKVPQQEQKMEETVKEENIGSELLEQPAPEGFLETRDDQPILDTTVSTKDYEIRFITTVGALSNLFETIKFLVSDAILKFSPEGLRIRLVDPGHVAFTYLNLPKDFSMFEEFECLEKELDVIIKPENAVKFLSDSNNKTAKIEVKKLKNDSMLYLNEIEEIVVSGKKRLKVNDTWALHQVETIAENPWTKTLKTFDYAIRMVLPTKDILKALTKHQQVSGEVKFIITPDKILLKTKSDLGIGNTPLRSQGDARVKDFKLIKPLQDGKFELSFELKFLFELLSSGNRFAEWFVLEVGNNMPLHISYIMPKGTYEQWQVARIIE